MNGSQTQGRKATFKVKVNIGVSKLTKENSAKLTPIVSDTIRLSRVQCKTRPCPSPELQSIATKASHTKSMSPFKSTPHRRTSNQSGVENVYGTANTSPIGLRKKMKGKHAISKTSTNPNYLDTP